MHVLIKSPNEGESLYLLNLDHCASIVPSGERTSHLCFEMIDGIARWAEFDSVPRRNAAFFALIGALQPVHLNDEGQDYVVSPPVSSINDTQSESE